MSLRLTWGFLVLLLAGLGSVSPARATERQVLLIQNSGWMEPYFLDAQSQFLPLVEAFAAATAVFGGDYVVATFNQDGELLPERSPNVLYDGVADPDPVVAAVARATLPRRANQRYADADFFGALIRTMHDLLNGGGGVVWMITNNKNSPNNSSEVVQNTRKFFKELRESDSVSRIVSFPLRMAVTGPSYAEKGLIIYGIGLGADGARMLAQLEASSAIRDLIADPAVLLKPLYQAPLTFIPRAVEPAGLGIEMDGQGGVILRGLSGDAPQEVVVRGEILSGYYPHVIREAVLSAGWSPLAGVDAHQVVGVGVTIQPERIENVMPATPYGGIELHFTLPALPRAEGLSGLAPENREFAGAVRIDLRALRLEQTPAFVAKLQDIAALDQVPELFFDFQKISHASAMIPTRMEVVYSPWPLFAAIGGLATLLLGGVLAFRPRGYGVMVGGRAMYARLRPFQSVTLVEPTSGARTQVSRVGFGGVTTKPL